MWVQRQGLEPPMRMGRDLGELLVWERDPSPSRWPDVFHAYVDDSWSFHGCYRGEQWNFEGVTTGPLTAVGILDAFIVIDPLLVDDVRTLPALSRLAVHSDAGLRELAQRHPRYARLDEAVLVEAALIG